MAHRTVVNLMNGISLLTQLKSGLQALGEDPLVHPCDSYLAYIDLLDKWNQAYNLSGIKKKEQMLTHHVLDSLAVLPYLHGSSALDVGAGAGLPGFILALARPDMRWVLLDSNQKKTRFMNQALLELGPENIEVVCVRVEDYQPEQLFSTITCRALMSAAAFCELTNALLEREGRIMMMKGLAVDEEKEQIDSAQYSVEVKPLNVPGLEAARHLLMMERRTPF
jgi:16S rRNA (guanine527-N7)-methyltransferase